MYDRLIAPGAATVIDTFAPGGSFDVIFFSRSLTRLDATSSLASRIARWHPDSIGRKFADRNRSSQ